MAFRVYLSYSLEPAESALAWRLQTLATAHGIEMYVPNYELAQVPGALAIQPAMNRADCVLAILTTEAHPTVQTELSYALETHKLVIPIVRSNIAAHPLLAQFPRVFPFTPCESPVTVETQIRDYLNGQSLAKPEQQVIGALAAIALGLLLLSSLNP